MHRTRAAVTAAAATAAITVAAASLVLPTASAQLVSRPDQVVAPPDGVSAVAAKPHRKKRGPFTVVVIPDTQHYSEDNPSIYRHQTRWIVRHRRALNIKFVAHLGDMVQKYQQRDQWVVADSAHDTLDRAGVHYAVVPGNHDISRSGETPYYDQFFRPRRFAGKRWYLGYLGDSKSGRRQGTGADRVRDNGHHRLNKDSYQVVRASGVRLVFINLEVDTPRYAVSWAKRVVRSQLRQHPKTKFVLVTHAYLDTHAQRPNETIHRDNGESASYVWRELVQPNCSIRLVLNGHYHGEARRTDRNRCGQKVHQLLSDYQTRAHGGDGWLRIMTFRPRRDRIRVLTYSPSLHRYETDRSSQFRLRFPMPR